MGFNGFISYSHAADGRLAPAIQRGLHRLARPWHRRRALWIFRDQTGLSVTPGLWSSIQRALDGSDYFVLLASPEAARSKWVNREIEHWVDTKPADRILPVVTDGTWTWDPFAGDFAEESTAVPPALRGVFAEEPLYLDLRWARNEAQLTLRHSRFRDAIAQLAAPMHGLSKDDLEGEDVRQHRRARRLQSGAVVTLFMLTLFALLAGGLAVRNATRANVAAAEARRQQQVAAQQHSSAERSAEDAKRQQELASEQERLAEQAKTEAARQEQLAQQQKALAKQASRDAGLQQRNAKRQRELAAEAGTRARAEQRLAQQQRALAARWAEQARQQEKSAHEQQQRAEEATEDARQQLAKAEVQQRIAVAQRLINQAQATIGDDPGKALMLGAAAQTVDRSAEIRGEVTSMITSTHYARTLDGVGAVVYGPGGLMITVSGVQTVSLWDVDDRTNLVHLCTLDENFRLVRDVAVSRDGQTLAIADDEQSVTLWDVTNRTNPVRLTDIPGKPSWVKFSPDGRTLATGDGSTVTLWDTANRTQPKKLTTLAAFGFAVSSDGHIVATSQGSAVTIWNFVDRTHPTQLAKLNRSSDQIESAQLSPIGKPLLVLATSDGKVELWDLSDPTQPRRQAMLSAAESVVSVAFSPDARTLAISDTEKKTTMWDISNAAYPFRYDSITSHAPAEWISFSSDGRTLATIQDAAYPGLAKATLWRTTGHGTPETVAHLDAGKAGQMAAAYSADGHLLAIAYYDGTVMFWDVTKPVHPILRATLASARSADAMAFSPDARLLASDVEGRVTLSDITDPSHPVKLSTFDQDVLVPGAMWFAPNGRTLAITATNGDLELWDLTNRTQPRRFSTLTSDDGNSMLPVAFSPDGYTLAVRNGARTVALWKLSGHSAPMRLSTLKHMNLGVTSVAFSPDGHTVAIGTTDHSAILWNVSDLAHPRELITVNGYTGWAGWLSFSPDGHILTFGDAAGTTLWDLGDLAKPVPLTSLGRDGQEAIPVFSPDGHTMTVFKWSGSTAGVALLDYTQLNNLRANPAEQACAIAGRGLNADEWQRYIPELSYQPSCPN